MFNYSTEEDNFKARNRLFKKWIMEYIELTTIQFYQHDYSNEVSLCALYYRRGGDKFHQFKNDIEGFIKNAGDSVGLNK